MRLRLIRSEGFRIAAIFVALFTLSAALMAASVLVIVQREFRAQVIQFANDDIAAVKNGFDTEGVQEAQEVVEQRMSSPDGSDYMLLQQGGRRLAGNLPPMTAKDGVVTLPVPGAHDPRQILGVTAILAPGLSVFSGSDLHRTYVARQHILRAMIWIFLAANMVAILAAMLVSRGFLSRTDAIARACRAIMDGNLKTRVPLRGGQDALDQLSENINAMLDRIVGLMENVRQVTNDVAHDLRTPLTHLRHRLEHARATAAAPADYDRTLESAIAALDGILTLFAALLRIAQIEGGARRAGFAPLELAELLHHLRDMFAPVADDAQHILDLAAAGPAIISGDRELVVQMLTNLIENAIVHTPAGTHIYLSLDSTAANAVVSVSDDGPGVPPEEHDKLFRRLYRREASRKEPGYGLGLALVSAIADLHGGKIATRQAQPGFCVSISFPLLSP